MAFISNEIAEKEKTMLEEKALAKIALDKILGNHEVKSNHDYIDRYERMYENRYGNK